MGEAREGLIFIVAAYAVGKLQWRIYRSEHVDARYAGVDVAVEECREAVIELPQRQSALGHLLHFAADDVVVGGAVGVEGIVVVEAVDADKVDEHRCHAPQADRSAAGDEESAGLLLDELARHVVGTEVHRVALHEVLGLHRGQHGVGPAHVAVTLVASPE